MASETKSPSITIQPDALAYAKERGVAEHLPAVLEMTGRVFPTARRIEVVVEDDPSIPDFRYLIIQVHVVGWGWQQYLEAESNWRDELRKLGPTQVAMEYSLDLRIDEE
jgi:hypothetical protein